MKLKQKRKKTGMDRTRMVGMEWSKEGWNWSKRGKGDLSIGWDVKVALNWSKRRKT